MVPRRGSEASLSRRPTSPSSSGCIVGADGWKHYKGFSRRSISPGRSNWNRHSPRGPRTIATTIKDVGAELVQRTGDVGRYVLAHHLTEDQFRRIHRDLYEWLPDNLREDLASYEYSYHPECTARHFSSARCSRLKFFSDVKDYLYEKSEVLPANTYYERKALIQSLEDEHRGVLGIDKSER